VPAPPAATSCRGSAAPAPASSACRRSAPGPNSWTAPSPARRAGPPTSSPPSAPATAASACSPASKPDRVDTSLGDPGFDSEGRVQLAHFGGLVVANVYFPNGKGSDRDNSRVPYKLAFYRHLFDHLGELRRAGRRVLVLGDFNTAHNDIDLARPRQNTKLSGFLPEERAELTRWLADGWVDTFRRFNPEPGHYSWWSPQASARARNIGWRLDYVLACPAAAPFLRAAEIHPEVTGSDHCPVSVAVDPAICDLTPPA
jgi:exodeoxyribonuclease-3